MLFRSKIKLSFYALKKLALVMREAAFSVRCVLKKTAHGYSVLDVFAANDIEPVCGLAIDIGTTTVSGVLTDLETGKILSKASAGNGQIRYGADVINRITESVKPDGAANLQKAIIRETLMPLINLLCQDAKSTKERIYKICIAGNTTMNHLLLGLYSDPVRMEPYLPSLFACDAICAHAVFRGLNTVCSLSLAPNVGSYVGGDITAGTLTSMMWNKSELSLFIDLGTNGELVLPPTLENWSLDPKFQL